MSAEFISREVARILAEYDERDPARLAAAMGIPVLHEVMGSFPEACKGFILCQGEQRVIVVNSSLPEELQPVILAHELGHGVLHVCQMESPRAFHDFSLYDSVSRCEYEANLFAAELLLEDATVIEKLNEDDFFFNVAKQLKVPQELLDFKFRILKAKGWSLESPIAARGDFLRHVTDETRRGGATGE